MIKFQDDIINKIETTELKDFPHTLLLLGDRGCGKHTVSNYISETKGLPLFDITDSLNLDTLNEIYINTTSAIYLINADSISIKEQNVILKFLEEPSDLIYIILLCSSKAMLLPTITNRCAVWEFHKHTKEELKEFTDDENILALCTTVGQILDCQTFNLAEMQAYCTKIFECINRASVPNILYALPKHIAWKGEKDLYPIDILFKILYKTVCDMVISGYNCFDMWELTHKFINDLNIPNIDKKQRYEKYLIDLQNWYKYKDEH